jgi:LPS export ABC transporter protein LptC
LSRRRRIIFGVALILVAAGLTFVATWYVVIPRWRVARGTVAPAASSSNAVDINNPTLRHTENGKLAWQIRLQKIALSRGGTTVGASGLREGLIYNAQGQPTVRVTAKSAQGDTLQKNFQLDGDVHVVSDQGALITTEQVRWVQAEQKLNCPGPVTVRAKDAVIISTGVDYTVNDGVVIAPNQVKMYAGKNKVVGTGLRYDVKTSAFTLQQVQMVLDTKEAQARLKGPRP